VQRTLDFPVRDVGKVPLVRPRKTERASPFDELIAEEEARDLEEHWRLLYVGLTRAEERLVIVGLQPKTKDGVLPENCWYTSVERALVSLGANPENDEVWGQVLRYRGSVAGTEVKPKPAPLFLSPPLIPDWASTPAPPEARPPQPLAPSAIAEDSEALPPPSDALRAAAERGTLIHHLLERLADVEPGQRHSTASRWLERSAGLTDAAAQTEIADTVCEVLSDPRFSALFGAGSLAEAPLAATLPDGTVVAGTVDRLLVEQSRVSVIDFKTGQVPRSDDAIPASHKAQMDAYTGALRVIFPGREVRAALLYTSGPQLFELEC
jgi:ATP-dependent helicase/nuclease subunit A